VGVGKRARFVIGFRLAQITGGDFLPTTSAGAPPIIACVPLLHFDRASDDRFRTR
jgi:hypothetical protein